jgi:hypothetical protein
MGIFVERVRNGKIPQPTQRQFSKDKWSDEFNKLDSPSEEDVRLFETGKWIFEKFESIRERLKTPSLDAICREDLLRLLVGMTNRIAFLMVHTSVSVTDNFSIESAIQSNLSQINAADPTSTPDMVLTASVDSLRFPLRRALDHRTRNSTVADEVEALNNVHFASVLGQFYEVYDSLWMSTLWGGRYLKHSGGVDRVMPASSKEAIVSAVSEHRRQMLSGLSAYLVAAAWNGIDPELRIRHLKTVPNVSVKGRGKKRRFQISPGFAGSPRSNIILHYRLLAEREYYSPFFKVPLPNLTGINISEVLAVAEVLHVVAAAEMNSLPSPKTESAITRFEALFVYSPILYFDEISELIKRHLSFSHDKIRKILAFLTTASDSRAELWAKPLVAIDEKRFLMIWAPLVLGNISRTVELWMKEGGLDISQGGFHFEDYARSEIQDRIRRSPILTDMEVYDTNFILEVGDECEEIDLVIRLGSTILLGELKCILFPAEPLERYRYFETLVSASSQIRRKLDFVQKYKREFLSKLDLNRASEDTDFSFFPFILVNQAFGVGFAPDDVPVTDLLILDRFLDGALEQFVTVSPSGDSSAQKTTVFYESQDGASERVIEYLKNPPQLRHLFSHVTVTGKRLPAISEKDNPVELYSLEVKLPLEASKLEIRSDPWL